MGIVLHVEYKVFLCIMLHMLINTSNRVMIPHNKQYRTLELWQEKKCSSEIIINTAWGSV